jgi:hypothetical protein
MNILEVGKPYTGPVPQQDGLVFEIGPDGDMQLLIQFRNPDAQEKEALLAGFRQYSLYRHPGVLPIACWVFKFAAPVMYMDAPFYAKLYTDGRAEKFLDKDQNMLMVTILDGPIVQGLRVVGLHPKVMELFKEFVKKQLTTHNHEQQALSYLYNVAIDEMYDRCSSEEIFHLGAQFSHRETKQ